MISNFETFKERKRDMLKITQTTTLSEQFLIYDYCYH